MHTYKFWKDSVPLLDVDLTIRAHDWCAAKDHVIHFINVGILRRHKMNMRLALVLLIGATNVYANSITCGLDNTDVSVGDTMDTLLRVCGIPQHVAETAQYNYLEYNKETHTVTITVAKSTGVIVDVQ